MYASLDDHRICKKKGKNERDELLEEREYIEGLVNNPINSD